MFGVGSLCPNIAPTVASDLVRQWLARYTVPTVEARSRSPGG